MKELMVLVLAVATTISNAASTGEGAGADAFKFGVDLYTAVHSEGPDKNVIVSPLSVQTALGLLLMGANGTTADQIVRGLHLKSSDRTILASHFQETLGRFSGDDKLKIANKVYVKTGYELDPQFGKLAKEQFGSEAESVNFADSNAAANNINSWVEDHTNNKIKDLISSDSLNDDTRMVLINAVHFKAAWQDKFYNESTRKRDFWISETESVQVDTMFGDIDVEYGENKDLDAKVVFIPYKDSPLSMMILLPNAKTGLQLIEAKLRDLDLKSLTNDLNTGNVNLLLPKFKIESNVDLKAVLSKMGMTDMFTDDANLPSLIKSDEPLKVDEAVHKTYINVDEEGTEAAAATALKIVLQSIPPRIQVDRPFMFAITNLNDVVFIGSIRNLV